MFLFWPSLILAVYVVCSGVLPLKIHWFWKLLSAAVIFLISMKYMVYTMNGGTFFEPAVKGAWMLTWEALYGALILAAFLLLLKDICSLGLWLLGTFGVKTGFSFNRLVFIVPIFIVSVLAGSQRLYKPYVSSHGPQANLSSDRHSALLTGGRGQYLDKS